MKFSSSEKLIILMLCDIMKSLELNGKEMSFDPNFIESVISYDYPWALPLKYTLTFDKDEQSIPKNVRKVFDILNMWRMIEWSFNELSEKDKNEIQNKKLKTKFFGFDGNEEDEYSVANFIINTLGRYNEFKDRYLNAHRPTMWYYQAMLDKYSSLDKKYDRMSKEDLIYVLSAPDRI